MGWNLVQSKLLQYHYHTTTGVSTCGLDCREEGICEHVCSQSSVAKLSVVRPESS